MKTDSQRVRELLNEGSITEAVRVAQWSNGEAAYRVLTKAGWTLDGTAVRPECPCSFYRSAPRAHDRLLDFPNLKPSIQFFTLLNTVLLDAADRIGGDDLPLFVVPEEIEAFFRMHDRNASELFGGPYPISKMMQLARSVSCARQLASVAAKLEGQS